MSLLIGLTSPGRADILSPVELTIRTGEVRDVDLSLGNDGRSDLTLRAEVFPADGASWPEGGELEIGVPEGEEGQMVGLAMVPAGRSGLRLRLRVVAANCCARGTFTAHVQLTPMETATGAYVGSPFVLPVVVTVEPGVRCGLLAAKLAGGTLLVGFAYLFTRNVYKQSHFFAASDLAGKLRAQVWGAYGSVDRPHQEAVLDKVNDQLRPRLRDRIGAWLRANPLRIGIPGRFYEETFRLRLSRKHFYLEVAGQRSAPEKGDLFARKTRLGVVLVATADDQGRISGLRVEPEVRKGATLQLRGHRLLDPEPDTDATDAGWRI